MPVFQKRHYEAIAAEAQESLRLIKDTHEQHGVWVLIGGLAEVFKRDNSGFDRDRFMRACVPGANVKARS